MKRRTPMKSSGFKRKNSAENTPSKAAESHIQQAQSAIISVVKSQPQTPPVTPAFRCSIPKSAPLRSATYRRAVASLPCIVCGVTGRSQAAHMSMAGAATGKGMGIKSCDLLCAPLCADRPGVRGHHSQLDQGALYTKAARHFIEPAWVADTQRRIHAMGLWPKGVPYPHETVTQERPEP